MLPNIFWLVSKLILAANKRLTECVYWRGWLQNRMVLPHIFREQNGTIDVRREIEAESRYQPFNLGLDAEPVAHGKE